MRLRTVNGVIENFVLQKKLSVITKSNATYELYHYFFLDSRFDYHHDLFRIVKEQDETIQRIL
jgi:hypothetical protein